MSTTVTVPLPLNIDRESRPLYAPYRQYSIVRQKVLFLSDIFVTASGLALDGNGMVKECHHDYPGQYGTLLREAMKEIRKSRQDEDFVVTLNDETTYLLIHHPWYNYYHWICELIFRLWMVRKSLDHLTLLLPEQYSRAEFIMQSIKPFAPRNIYYIPPGKNIFVKNLCLPQIKPICDTYNAAHVRQIRNFYRKYVPDNATKAIFVSERLYVSRRYAGRRSVINEAEILPILEKFGFAIFFPEKVDFLGQVAIFSKVRFLVGEHGSGLTNILFMDRGTSILELHKDKTNELQHPSFLFWYLAEALDINYYHQSCTTMGKEDYFEGNYHVDPVLLEQNLAKMLAAKSLG